MLRQHHGLLYLIIISLFITGMELSMTEEQPLTSITDPDELWQKFFEATKDREPRETVVEALEYVSAPGKALDLGCGCGNDSLAMLKHGLTVTAIDGQEEAVRRTVEKAERNGFGERLNAMVSRFEDFELGGEEYDLIYSGFALPFCSQDYFPVFWELLLKALKPGGILAGQLFGDRDEWGSKPEHPANIFLSLEGFNHMTESLERLQFREEERDGTTALDCAKHWHVYHFILRKPADG